MIDRRSALGAGLEELGRRLARVRAETAALAAVLERLERSGGPPAPPARREDPPPAAPARRLAVELAVRGRGRNEVAEVLRGADVDVDAVLDDVFGAAQAPAQDEESATRRA